MRKMGFQVQYMSTLKAIADEARMAILELLKVEKLMTAGQIEHAVGKSHSTTSQNLKKLVNANILTFRQEGTQKFFSIRDPQIFDAIESIKSYISTSKVISSDTNSRTPQILLMGLDKSGKTSILLSFLGHKNLMPFISSNLKATRGQKHMVEVMNGLKLKIRNQPNFVFYEYGGQIVYRQEFKKKSDEILRNWDKIIYVIDIQDEKRYQESIEFLEEIMSVLDQIYPQFDLDVFLHKFDPGIEKNEPSKYSLQTLNAKIISKIRSSGKIRCVIYKSSIFTVFQKSPIIPI
jgi:DNA-binding transcriptional ArsR family regulator